MRNSTEKSAAEVLLLTFIRSETAEIIKSYTLMRESATVLHFALLLLYHICAQLYIYF